MGVGLFILGLAGICLALVSFVNGGRFVGAPKSLSPAEAEVVREEVGRRLSELAPRMLLLAERAREVDEALAWGSLDDEWWLKVERLMREAPMVGVWRRYSTASAFAGDRPLEALEELREVEWMVETALSKLDEARRACNVGGRA